MNQRALRRIGRCSARSVPIQTLDIQHARSEAQYPDLDRARDHARRTSDAHQRSPVDECLCDRIEDYLHAGDLSRQCLVRQHALAMQTITTARERDVENHRPVADVEPAPDAAPSKSQVAAAAQGTATPREELVTRSIDDRRVLARLDVEYENHVLVTAPGVPTLSGAVVCLPHSCPPRTWRGFRRETTRLSSAGTKNGTRVSTSVSHDSARPYRSL